MQTRTYRVVGMSCDHCVRAVRQELSSLDGVVGVDVELASGLVTVTADRLLDDPVVRDAVNEAGYEVQA
jgi:copper chaperone CopZ